MPGGFRMNCAVNEVECIARRQPVPRELRTKTALSNVAQGPVPRALSTGRMSKILCNSSAPALELLSAARGIARDRPSHYTEGGKLLVRGEGQALALRGRKKAIGTRRGTGPRPTREEKNYWRAARDRLPPPDGVRCHGRLRRFLLGFAARARVSEELQIQQQRCNLV